MGARKRYDFGLRLLFRVPFRLSSSYRVWAETSYAGSGTGFRLAGSSASSSVPEIDPATGGSVLSLVTGMLALLEQRRRRRTSPTA